MSTVSIPTISIPSTKKDMWLNINSDKSILSWYKTMNERRKKKNEDELKKTKEKLYKKKGNMFKLLNQEYKKDSKEWKQAFEEFEEENIISDDELDNKDDFLSLFFKR